jgi:hypothetical protein
VGGLDAAIEARAIAAAEAEIDAGKGARQSEEVALEACER